METYGWLLYEDNEGVSIAAERCLDQGEEYYRGRSFIPKALINSISPVSLHNQRKKKNEGVQMQPKT